MILLMMSATSKKIRVRKLDFLLSYIGVMTFIPSDMVVNSGRKIVLELVRQNHLVLIGAVQTYSEA